MPPLPDFTTPDELAAHLGASPRAVREKAAELGACRRVGAKLIMLPEDVDRFMEALRPCPCEFSAATAATSGITEEARPAGDSEALRRRLTARTLKGSRQKSKPPRGEVVSMGRARG